MKKIPLKMSIIRWVSTRKDAAADDVYRSLAAEYGSERQFRRKSIEEMLQTMRAVGIIEIKDFEQSETGEPVPRYAITEYGRSRLKYIP